MNTNKTLGSFSPELQLMLACVDSHALNGNTEKIKKLLIPSIDWSAFVQLAIHHRLYPLVYKTLSSLNEEVMPSKFVEILREKSRENAIQALRYTGAAAVVTNKLETEDIHSIVLKGPSLAERLYGDVALRPFKDIDLLVCPEDLERTGEGLEQLGYRRTNIDFPLTPARHKWYIRQYHHHTYWHSGQKIQIELHWKCGLPLSDARTIQRIQAGCTLPVLPDEEWFLYLVFHGARHAWFRLRWLCDIAEFSKKDLDWERVQNMAEKFDVQPLLHQSLILANVLLELTVPKSLQAAIDRDDKAWRLANLAKPFFQDGCYEPGDDSGRRDWQLFWLQHNYNLQIRSSCIRKISYILGLLAPIGEDVKRFSLPDRLFYTYYILRPFTWAWRHAKLLQVNK